MANFVLPPCFHRAVRTSLRATTASTDQLTRIDDVEQGIAWAG